MGWTERVAGGAFGALLTWSAGAHEPSPQRLSCKAIPSAQVELDLDAATYDQREAFTRAASERIAPRVIEAAAFDPETVETEVTPGGHS